MPGKGLTREYMHISHLLVYHHSGWPAQVDKQFVSLGTCHHIVQGMLRTMHCADVYLCISLTNTMYEGRHETNFGAAGLLFWLGTNSLQAAAHMNRLEQISHALLQNWARTQTNTMSHAIPILHKPNMAGASLFL